MNDTSGYLGPEPPAKKVSLWRLLGRILLAWLLFMAAFFVCAAWLQSLFWGTLIGTRDRTVVMHMVPVAPGKTRPLYDIEDHLAGMFSYDGQLAFGTQHAVWANHATEERASTGSYLPESPVIHGFGLYHLQNLDAFLPTIGGHGPCPSAGRIDMGTVRFSGDDHAYSSSRITFPHWLLALLLALGVVRVLTGPWIRRRIHPRTAFPVEFKAPSE